MSVIRRQFKKGKMKALLYIIYFANFDRSKCIVPKRSINDFTQIMYYDALDDNVTDYRTTDHPLAFQSLPNKIIIPDDWPGSIIITPRNRTISTSQIKSRNCNITNITDTSPLDRMMRRYDSIHNRSDFPVYYIDKPMIIAEENKKENSEEHDLPHDFGDKQQNQTPLVMLYDEQIKRNYLNYKLQNSVGNTVGWLQNRIKAHEKINSNIDRNEEIRDVTFDNGGLNKHKILRNKLEHQISAYHDKGNNKLIEKANNLQIQINALEGKRLRKISRANELQNQVINLNYVHNSNTRKDDQNKYQLNIQDDGQSVKVAGHNELNNKLITLNRGLDSDDDLQYRMITTVNWLKNRMSTARESDFNIINDFIGDSDLSDNVLSIQRKSLSDEKSLKQILFWKFCQWQNSSMLSEINPGRSVFIDNDCEYKNCFIVKEGVRPSPLTEYDAIIFYHGTYRLPLYRSIDQKYIIMFAESSTTFPYFSAFYNQFFNWTMSYRLDADIKYTYIQIYDSNDTLVGPSKNMQWRQNMDPISQSVKKRLKSKRKLAAIFMSNCHASSGRTMILDMLKRSLRRYNMTIDIYGACGILECPKEEMWKCHNKLETEYFFYLSFENSFAVDYVTEQLLHAVQHYTVPIVYGGANYSRFLPNGSYLNACNRDPKELALQMVGIMSNWTRYYDFFRYTNHYKYKGKKLDVMCNLCEKLNSKKAMKTYSYYNNFVGWHNTDYDESCH